MRTLKVSPHKSNKSFKITKRGTKVSASQKKREFHCNSLTCSKRQAKKARRKERTFMGTDAFSRRDSMYGLCSRCVKLFKRGVNAIHQIVWNCVKISETIWPPNVRVFFMWLDTLVSVWWTAGVQPCAIVTCHIRVDGSFVLSFHALRWKLQLHPWTKRII